MYATDVVNDPWIWKGERIKIMKHEIILKVVFSGFFRIFRQPPNCDYLGTWIIFLKITFDIHEKGALTYDTRTPGGGGSQKA